MDLAEDRKILQKCTVDIKVWTAVTAKKHPLVRLSKGSDNDLITYAFAGTVKSCGHGLLNYNLNERVAGLITSEQFQTRDGSPVFPKEIEIEESFLVSIPPEVNPADCAASLIPAVKCFTAFRTIANRKPNESALLLCHGSSNTLCLSLQLCQHWKFRPIVVTSDDNEQKVLRSFSRECPKFFRLTNNKAFSKLAEEILDYTGGIGVSIIFDFGYDESISSTTVDLADILITLSPFGHFITDRHTIQLSESQSNILHLKCANINYIFPEIWILSPLQLGKYQQIINTIMERLKDRTIKPKIDETIEVKIPTLKNFVLNSTKNCIVYKNV